MLRYDQNSGPLTLIHDPTPRSLDQNLNNPTSNVGNFRIKGFVNHNFVKPTIPRTIPAEGIRTSADNPSLDLKIPPPQKSVGSPQKSVTSLPKSVASSRKSASPTKSVVIPSPAKSVAPASPVRAAGLPSQPASKGSAQRSHSVMDGRQSHQSSRRPDLTSRSSRRNQIDQNIDSLSGWAKERTSPRHDSHDHPLSYRSVNQHQGRHYADDYEGNQNIPIRNAHEKTSEQIKKETQQFIDRKEEERRFREESQNRLREKHEEQRRTREMLEEHEPFGRPGAGAPNGNDNKKKKFIEEQFNARGEPARYQLEPDRYVRDIENHRRHDRPPEEKKKYYDDLKQQEQEKKLNGHNPDMAREQDQGLDGMPPFHSPGRNGMDSERQRYNQVQENLQHMRRMNAALERSSPDQMTNADTYMKQRAGIGPGYGSFLKSSAPDTNIRYDDNPYDNVGKVGPPLKPNREYLPQYDPFGKSGGGAPRKDELGNRITKNQGLMSRSMQSYLARQEEERMNERRNQLKYREALDLQVEQNARKDNEAKRHIHQSEREFAEIIDSYRAPPRPTHHLPHSDISRARDGRVQLDVRGAREYHEELDIGYSNNLTKKRLDKLKDNQESRRHMDKMATYWGRYGGGNRKNEQFTHKGNLDNLINNAEKGRFSMSDVYVKGKDWSHFDEKITPRYASQDDDLSPRFTRVTVDSHHANQYDYPMAGPSYTKKSYEMNLPWAPH